MNLRRTVRKMIRGVRACSPLPLILMYHRIANVPIDPWGLAVSPANFQDHLDVLRRTRRPLRFADFVDRLQSGTLPTNAVAITFDDGYVDNLVMAKPLLSKADVPATVFLATGYIGDPNPFWWDELARLVLAETGPQWITVDLPRIKLSCKLGAEPSQDDTKDWRAWWACRTARQGAYLAIWRALRSAGYDERMNWMNGNRHSFSQNLLDEEPGRPMTSREVRELVNDGLITVGAHTVTHPSLVETHHAEAVAELDDSRVDSEDLCSARVIGFAYPYGDFDAGVCAAVRATGFAYSCSTQHGPVTTGSDLFALPRIHVLDWGGDDFEETLRSVSANRS